MSSNALLAGVGGLLNSGLNFLSNVFLGDRDKAFAEQQATTAFERQQQLINEQRAYDSPSAQMQRFIDAGLNPNLIYGELAAPGSASQVSMGDSPHTVPPNLSLGISDYLNQQLIDAKIKDLNSQVDAREQLTPSEVKKNLAAAGLSDAMAEKCIREFPLVDANISVAKQTLHNLKAEYNLLSIDEALKIQDYNFKRSINPLHVRQLQYQLHCDKTTAESISRLIDATINELISRNDLNQTHANLNRSTVLLNNSHINLNDKESQVKDALINLYDSQKNLNSTNESYIAAQKIVYDKYGEQATLIGILNTLSQSYNSFRPDAISINNPLRKVGTDLENYYRNHRFKPN